jgi:hypothetical protein
MECKITRRWQLQDLLHAAGKKGITQSDYGDPNGDVTQARRDPVKPALIGNQTELNFEWRTGLPDSVDPWGIMGIFRAIAVATTGTHTTLQWLPPIRCATQLKLTLEDFQLDAEDDRRYSKVILRAQPLFQGRPAQDNVKLLIEEENDISRIYFGKYVVTFVVTFVATFVVTFVYTSFPLLHNIIFLYFMSPYRCLAFLEDAAHKIFVAVRWYQKRTRTPPNTLLLLTGLELAPKMLTTSYSVLPIACIVNGALLVECEGTYWAVLSPREETAYVRSTMNKPVTKKKKKKVTRSSALGTKH